MFVLPPVPMASMFDVRFATGTSLETAQSTVVKIQGAEYPCSIAIQNVTTEYTVSDAVTGEKIGVISANNPIVLIKNSNTTQIRIEQVIADDANMSVAPNPVTELAVVKYALTSDEFTTVKVYNAIGNEVMTVSSGFQKAGENIVELSVSNLPAGQYYCKVVAGNTVMKQTLTVIR